MAWAGVRIRVFVEHFSAVCTICRLRGALRAVGKGRHTDAERGDTEMGRPDYWNSVGPEDRETRRGQSDQGLTREFYRTDPISERAAMASNNL